MGRLPTWAVIALCVVLIGCGETGLTKRTEPLKDEPAGRKYLDLLIQGQVDEIKKDLDPAVADTDRQEKLVQIAQWLPAEAPKSVKAVDSRTIQRPGFRETQLGYECEFENSWFLVTVPQKETGCMGGSRSARRSSS
jgi:hypothetical protein